jgi:hypothetical protein
MERTIALLTLHRCANNEAHDFIRAVVVFVGLDVTVVTESNVLASIGTEVNNCLPSFSHGDLKISGWNRLGEKPSIAPNDMEWNGLAARIFKV